MQVCPQCGHDNVEPDARFCAACGHALTVVGAPGESPAEATGTLSALVEGEPESEASPAEAGGMEPGLAERLHSGTALLVVKRGPSAGARFLLDADLTTAGRHPDSDIFLDDITVSRHHAEFHREGGQYRVHDVGSLNGTYVNRERIDDVTLSNGDEVQIGKYRLVYLAGAGS
jgi:pSer/pThr/pTyr-binding forkhead associated (FHA) protein